MKTFLKDKVFSHMGLKLLALLLATLLWLAVMNISDPTISKTVTGISVEALNGDAIKASGYLYSITSGSTVDVVVKGPRSIVENMGAGNFYASADLSQLSVTNTATISVETNESIKAENARKIEITVVDQYMNVSIEESAESNFQVKVITRGSLPDGYALGTPVATPNVVTITAAESVINSIAEVRAVVSINGLTSDLTTKVELGCVDAYGNAIDETDMTYSASEVEVTVPVYTTKEIPINVTTKGEVASGYGIVNIYYDPTSVVVAGEADNLDTLDSIDIAIDVTDGSDDIEQNVDLSDYLPDGVIIGDSTDNVAVSVDVQQYETRSFSLTASDISVLNKSDDYTYTLTLTSTGNVTVMGFEEAIESLTTADLGASVDVANLTAGNNYVIKLSFAESDEYEISGSYVVIVNIAEPQTEAETEAETASEDEGN